MYPYSEFLQKELYDSDRLSEDGDKIKNDFRITYWGKILESFWIDELPQIYNLSKGILVLWELELLVQQNLNYLTRNFKT